MVSVFGAEKRVAALGALLSALACSSETHTNAKADASPEPHHGSDAGDGGSAVTPAPEGEPYGALEEWHLFKDAARQIPSSGVVPYDVNSPLFADYAAKRRFIYVPEGKKIG